MAEVSAAEQAYEAALREIERVREAGERRLVLSGDGFTQLDRIPPEVKYITGLRELKLDHTDVSSLDILAGMTRLRRLEMNETKVHDLSALAALTNLQYLYFNKTEVSELAPVGMLAGLKRLYLNQSKVIDLAPVAALNGLEGLFMNQTRIHDLSPIASLSELQWLYLNQTDVSDLSPVRTLSKLQWLHLSLSKVRDLRPLASLLILNSAANCRIQYSNTPATKYDPVLHRLSQIADDQERTRETLAYLKTLPPWPEHSPSLTDGHAPPARREPSRQGDAFPPAVPLSAGLRRITLAEARHILVSDRPQLRARCQHVVAVLDDALAIQAVRIPNEPEQLAAHTAITN